MLLNSKEFTQVVKNGVLQLLLHQFTSFGSALPCIDAAKFTNNSDTALAGLAAMSTHWHSASAAGARIRLASSLAADRPPLTTSAAPALDSDTWALGWSRFCEHERASATVRLTARACGRLPSSCGARGAAGSGLGGSAAGPN